MRFDVVWDYPALTRWYQLPRKTAETLAVAVVRFSETGEGDIEWAAPYYRLRTSTHEIALSVDREARTITVIRFYRFG
jgi:hypothetical protein